MTQDPPPYGPGPAAHPGNPALFGDYVLLELIGAGGMGQVYRAHDRTHDRDVALKVLRAEFADDEQFRERFRSEAQSVGRLTDPHVIPIHGYGEIDGRLYLDMRLVEGHDLGSELQGGRRLSDERTVAILTQVASALDSAHQAGLVHRDVKPSNILLDTNDFAYLVDFGIASGAKASHHTGTGTVVGSWAYLAPERWSGSSGQSVDVYALACGLFECLTGQRAFPGDELPVLLSQHVAGPRPRVTQFRPDLPPRIDGILATGLAIDPADRPPSATALMTWVGQALRTQSALPNQAAPRDRADQPTREAAIAGTPVLARQPDPSAGWPPSRPTGRTGAPPPATRSRRSTAVWALAAAVALVTVGIGILLMLHRSGASANSQHGSPGASAASSASTSLTMASTAQSSPPVSSPSVSISSLSASTPSTAALTAPTSFTETTNGQFGYTIDLPATWHNTTSGANVTSTSPDNTSQITVSGANNSSGATLAQARSSAVQQLGASGSSITYSATGSTWFVLSGYQSDGSIYYLKEFVGPGSINRYQAIYPGSRRELYYSAMSHVANSFHNGNLATSH